MGGVVPRNELSHLLPIEGRILLEDPLTGRDVATGSYRVAAVQAAFRRAARRLEQLASTHHNGSKQGSSARVNYLEGLFNVQRVLSRDGSSRPVKGGRGLGLAEGGGVVAEEYYVLGRGGGYTVSTLVLTVCACSCSGGFL